MSIINSLLDTDWYKFTMAQAVLQKFASANVSYTFKNRAGKTSPLGHLAARVEEEVNAFKTLRFQKDELDWLSQFPTLKPHFIDFLRTLDLSDVNVVVLESDDKDLEIFVEGPWIKAIWFEVPVLAIVNELSSVKYLATKPLPEEVIAGGMNILDDKIKIVRDYNQGRSKDDILRFAEFGTRRRFSRATQEAIALKLNTACRGQWPYMVGSSNVALSRKMGTNPIGTMAHEWIQAGQAFTHPLDSQIYMLDAWRDVYGEYYNIALTDTLGSDKFMFDMSKKNLGFLGFRQDSGDPYEWTDKLLFALSKSKIDPKNVTVVYSDSLSFLRAIEILERYRGTFKTILFGIGTDLTNDFPKYNALNVVMKLIEVNGRVVAKISDNTGKAISDSQKYLDYLQEEINFESKSEGWHGWNE